MHKSSQFIHLIFIFLLMVTFTTPRVTTNRAHETREFLSQLNSRAGTVCIPGDSLYANPCGFISAGGGGFGFGYVSTGNCCPPYRCRVFIHYPNVFICLV
ncbi:hypothetical protein I4U23_021942 [Adineta vaga]|nr:hypothetical protein I4U23_021942 [Adineta vaga]